MKSIKAIFAATLLLTTHLSSQASEHLTSEKAASVLRDGGYVLYMRHASTEKDYADQVTADVSNCSTQRTLSEKGWLEAGKIGAAFSELRIPVGKVISSEYCRAWQTAKIAFGSYKKTDKLNFEPSEEYSETQMKTMRSRVTPMLQMRPEAGKNTIIVGHDDPFEAATGIYPEPQGVIYVLRPKENGFDVVGFVNPTDWLNTPSKNN